MGQMIGTLVGLVAAFLICFLVLTFGSIIPEDVIASAIVTDFLERPDLELKLAVVGTVLYPAALGSASLGSVMNFGAQGATVLMFIAWGVGGLIAGLMTRDIVQGVFAAIFSAIIGAFLIWILIFFVQVGDASQIFNGESLYIMQVTLEGIVYPIIASLVGGLLGGGISRDRY